LPANVPSAKELKGYHSWQLHIGIVEGAYGDSRNAWYRASAGLLFEPGGGKEYRRRFDFHDKGMVIP